MVSPCCPLNAGVKANQKPQKAHPILIRHGGPQLKPNEARPENRNYALDALASTKEKVHSMHDLIRSWLLISRGYEQGEIWGDLGAIREHSDHRGVHSGDTAFGPVYIPATQEVIMCIPKCSPGKRSDGWHSLGQVAPWRSLALSMPINKPWYEEALW